MKYNMKSIKLLRIFEIRNQVKIISIMILNYLGGQVMAQENNIRKEIRTEIIINANQQDVWKVLSDFEKYPEWNPFILDMKGKAVKDEKLEVSLLLKEDKTFDIKPTVQKAEEGSYFEWYGKSPLGFFNGRHYFKIEKIGDNQVKFIHGERFTGWLVRPILKKIGENTREGFIKMNKALKERVEEK